MKPNMIANPASLISLCIAPGCLRISAANKGVPRPTLRPNQIPTPPKGIVIRLINRMLGRTID